MERRVLIIVQNLPVPFDRRVWLECQALASAGYRVAVVCPKGKGDSSYQVVDIVEPQKYRPYAPGGSKVGFVAEYANSFLASAWLTLRARRAARFAVIQACNPPDIFWPIALALRAIEGTKFVFDHHNLCPELYEFGLAGHVEFTGRVPDELVASILSTANVGLSPDPKNPLDVSTMNESMEYMAFELPVVAFDLHETRVSVGEAGVYVKPNDIHDYAEAIVKLMDDEPRRADLGKLRRACVVQELAWSHQERAYLGVHQRLTAGARALQRTGS